MSSFTDPTNPIGGNTGTNTGNGFFEMGEVDGIGSGAGADDTYNPRAVQRAIMQLLSACGPHMSEFQVQNLMWLMQEYGNQDVGVDATNQTSMNQYFGDVQNMWGTLYSGDVSYATLTAMSASPTTEFQDELSSMYNSLTANPFLTGSGQGQQMLSELTGALNSIRELVDDVVPASGSPSNDAIWNMWQQYNGGDGGAPVSGTTSGSPDAMDSMMRELGQVNQDVTGISQSIGTQFQSDTNNQQSESGALNNYLQMLYKMTQVLVQNMQSAQ